jgi:hypothetical protein
VKTKYEKIMVLRSNGWNGKGNQANFSQWLDGTLEDIYRIAGTHEALAIRANLQKIHSGYVSDPNSTSVLPMKYSNCSAAVAGGSDNSPFCVSTLANASPSANVQPFGEPGKYYCQCELGLAR